MVIRLSTVEHQGINVVLLMQDVLFYGIPDHGHYYSELLNLLEGATSAEAAAQHATVTVLFCRYDALALSRVVGSSRSKKMLTSKAPTFMFC